MKLNTFKKSIMTFTMASILTINSLPTYAALGDANLKYDTKNSDVKELKTELLNLNYFDKDEKLSTYYGQSTIDAVIALQKDHGIQQTGIYGKQTHSKLIELKEEKFNKYKLSFNNDLRLKDENKDVHKLQKALKKLNFLEIENCTDYFGNITERALISFQRAVGITPDGIAGARTIKMINKALAGEDIFVETPNRGGERGSLGSNIASTGKKYIGTPYRSGQSGPGGFDCSGFTQYVYKQHGINVSRSSSTQANDGTWVAKNDLQPGDMLIFANTYKSGPSHTGIYIGDNQFIHSSSVRGGGVKISSLNESYYLNHYSSGRRVY